jgi:1,4-alpha-glucan branching enzyme
VGSRKKKDVGTIIHRDGVSFRVWAPNAKTVAVVGTFNNWQPSPLENEGDGYWATFIENVEAGAEYRFQIDTGTNLLLKNDPRALQVTTSAGNSVVVDPYFDWDNQQFTSPSFNKQILYEMHIGTFHREDASTPGTFDTAAKKLPYLADLGVNMIELMPIGSMPMDRGWGYATDFIYAVESLYGGRHGLLQFVKTAHEHGIGVILDVVYNHFGPDANLDLWQFDGWSENDKGGIYFYNDWRSTTPWGETRPDYGRPEVRQFIYDNVRMWIHDFRLDGLRVDSTVFIRNVYGHNNDPSHDIPDGWALLQGISSVARKINPNALLIAEDSSGNDYITKSKTEGGAGFSSQWEIDLPKVLRSVLDVPNDEARSITAIADALRRVYNGDAFQRTIYSDSHDSAGNGGKRINAEIQPDNPTGLYARRRSLLASAIILTAPGIPMLFQGQEFMEDGSFNDYSALDWEKANKLKGIVEAHKHLIALRKNQYSSTLGLSEHGFTVIHVNEGDKMLAYHRYSQGSPGDDVVIVLNFANKVQKNYGIDFPRNGLWRVRFNSDWKGYSEDFKNIETKDVAVENNKGTFDIGPYSSLIFSQDT